MSRFNAETPTPNELYARHSANCIDCFSVDSFLGGTRCQEGKKLVHAAHAHLRVHSFEPCMCAIRDCYCKCEYDLPISFAGADAVMQRILSEMA